MSVQEVYNKMNLRNIRGLLKIGVAINFGFRPPIGVQLREYRVNASEYLEYHARSIHPSTREKFWEKEADAITWSKRFTTVLDTSDYDGKNGLHFPRWFKDGELNMCFNCVDRHVARNPRGTALIYESQPLSHRKVITYKELQDNVCRVANVLKSHGVVKGQRVIIYMPVIPEAVYTMLACARLGAVHSVVFGGFGPKELASRIEDAKPQAIVTASHGYEPHRAVHYEPLLAEALERTSAHPNVIIAKNRNPDESEFHGDVVTKTFKREFIDYDEAVTSAADYILCEPMNSLDELYTLYTSGTTGKPKGVVRDTGGYATILQSSMQHFMNCPANDASEVYWAASDIGWILGHSFMVYAPLLNGTSTLLYEGKPLNIEYPYLMNHSQAEQRSQHLRAKLWENIERNKVTKAFTAPTALRAIRRVDPELKDLEKCDISSLEVLFVAGEPADPDTVEFFSRKLNIPIVDNYWQTEIGSPCLGYQTNETKCIPGSCGWPAPGSDVHIMKNGDVCVKLPLSPGNMKTVYGDDKRYFDGYLSQHDGYYFTGDVGERNPETGYFSIMSRTGDMINTAGHRLSTGSIEEAITAHPLVVECAVVGIKDDIKGHIPFAFVVFHDGVVDKLKVYKEINDSVKKNVGFVAALKAVVDVPALPKTRSGKILRGTLQAIINREKYDVPATIEDSAVLENVKEIIQQK